VRGVSHAIDMGTKGFSWEAEAHHVHKCVRQAEESRVIAPALHERPTKTFHGGSDVAAGGV